jgi:hypothetical protein
MCGNATFCTPATPQEIATPPLNDEEARLVFNRGILSGAMQHCGMDWERSSFLPMMAHWRAGGSKSDRQLALIGGLHGIGQRAIADTLKGQSCSNEAKAELERRVATTRLAAEPPALRVRAMLLVNLDKLMCGKALCAPATPEEIATPPINDQDTTLAFDRGLVSGTAEHCGLDWQLYVFRPMMLHWNDLGARSERQIVLFIAVHAMAQRSMRETLGSKGACTPEMKRELELALGVP